MSHPAWVRGLKLLRFIGNILSLLSHPAWVRGLKRDQQEKRKIFRKSHPAWVRGLKPVKGGAVFLHDEVAPCVGAWIETFPVLPYLSLCQVAPCVGAWIETLLKVPERFQPLSHPAWVRGLKHPYPGRRVSVAGSHPAWVRGLKQ